MFPVYKPVVNVVDMVAIEEGMDNITISCDIEAGLGAEVYWITPDDKRIPNIFYLSDNVGSGNSDPDDYTYLVLASNETSSQYKTIHHRTLQINLAGKLLNYFIGDYKCVVYDPGYPGKTEYYKEHSVNVYISLRPSFSSSNSYILTPTISESPTSQKDTNNSTQSQKVFVIIVTLTCFIITVIMLVFTILVVMAMHQLHCYKKDDVSIMSRKNSNKMSFLRQDSFIDAKPVSQAYKTPITAVNGLFFIELKKEFPRERLQFISKIGMMHMYGV